MSAPSAALAVTSARYARSPAAAILDPIGFPDLAVWSVRVELACLNCTIQGAPTALTLADWQKINDVTAPWQLFCNGIVEAAIQSTDVRLRQYPDSACET